MSVLRKISSFFKKSEEKPAANTAASARHILDFSEERCKLRVDGNMLAVEKEDGAVVTLPFADIAVILISNQHCTITQSVLENIALYGATLTVCNWQHIPVSMMLPLDNHSLPVQRLQMQINATQPMQKNAWQQITQAKILAQAQQLLHFNDDDAGLLALAKSVKSGDPENIEAQAARKYWSALFPNIDFHREPKNNDPLNNQLNYGYAVLRSMTARAICAVGFHPALGIHHCNQRNAFCLADDLMEPYRPQIDAAVATMFNLRKKFESLKMTKQLTPVCKKRLVSSLTMRFLANGENRRLFDILTMTVQSLVRFYAKETDTLYLPALERAETEES
jgi:CRISPR-associated protein Cas1